MLGAELLSAIQSCLILSDPTDYSPSGSSIHGISREGVLDGDAISPPEGLPRPGVEPVPPALAGKLFPTEPPGTPPCHHDPES